MNSEIEKEMKSWCVTTSSVEHSWFEGVWTEILGVTCLQTATTKDNRLNENVDNEAKRQRARPVS